MATATKPQSLISAMETVERETLAEQQQQYFELVKLQASGKMTKIEVDQAVRCLRSMDKSIADFESDVQSYIKRSADAALAATIDELRVEQDQATAASAQWRIDRKAKELEIEKMDRDIRLRNANASTRLSQATEARNRLIRNPLNPAVAERIQSLRDAEQRLIEEARQFDKALKAARILGDTTGNELDRMIRTNAHPSDIAGHQAECERQRGLAVQAQAGLDSANQRREVLRAEMTRVELMALEV